MRTPSMEISCIAGTYSFSTMCLILIAWLHSYDPLVRYFIAHKHIAGNTHLLVPVMRKVLGKGF